MNAYFIWHFLPDECYIGKYFLFQKAMGKIPPLEAAASDVTKRFVILGNFREMHEFVDIEIAVRRFQIQLALTTSCHIYGLNIGLSNGKSREN